MSLDNTSVNAVQLYSVSHSHVKHVKVVETYFSLE
jgi:hypothetical protein